VSYLQESLDHVTDLSSIQYHDTDRYPYLLDSVATDSAQGRYSILFGFPQQTITCHEVSKAAEFLEALEQRWLQNARPPGTQPLPYSGGWFVYLGYETVGGIEPSLDCPEFPYEFPVAFATRCPAAIIVDHLLQLTHCICEAGHEDLMAQLLTDVQNSHQSFAIGPLPGIRPVEDPADQYKTGVNAILEYIRSGDVFQVNLSRAWQIELDNKPAAASLYRHLCQSNPAPFACLVHHPSGNIISSSPERLVRVSDRRIETRPIAGTRPRTHDGKDMQWLDELRTDIKEQAEHIMLIDLERNDLGRVSEPGTIQVDELMVLESYAHVHHIVSNISGQLRSDVTPVDVLRAVFPGGTITGCPKVRCMEIIAELEKEGRGPYTGSVGYINHDGSMDFNILIRTLFQQQKNLHFRAGAGIVADSHADMELEETRHKAKGLLMALASE
jgi:anthranilate synthase component 1